MMYKQIVITYSGKLTFIFQVLPEVDPGNVPLREFTGH